MCRLLWRPSRHAGVRQLRGSWGHWRPHRSRTRNRSSSSLAKRPAVVARSGSSEPAFRPLMRSSVPVACRAARASPSAARRAPARRRSPSGSRRRPRSTAQSSPGSISPEASTRSRPSPAACASTGSSSSPRKRSTRACRSPARSSPVGRSTCSSWTCRRVRIPERLPLASPIAFAGSPRWPAARRRSSSLSSRPA